MSYLALKIIACVTMLIDHIGYYGFAGDYYFFFRAVGRIAFPLFAYFIANGYRHSHDKNKYTLRLAAFALISEIPFTLFSRNEVFVFRSANVMFTLLLGLLVMRVYHEFPAKKAIRLLVCAPALGVACLAAFYFGTDYGWLGVLLVVWFGLFNGKTVSSKAVMCAGAAVLSTWRVLSMLIVRTVNGILSVDLSAIPKIRFFFPGGDISDFTFTFIFSAFALVPILLYNDSLGYRPGTRTAKALKYGFYIFYPAHMLLMFLLRLAV